MTDASPSIVSHVSLGTNNMSIALPFYDAIMATVGATRKQVIDFDEIGIVAVALANGGTDEGAPGPRPHYGAEYYGCFVRDPDGNKLEATFWDTTKSVSF